MNSKQVNEYIRDNYRSMSDGELAAAISSMGFDITGEAVRKRRISMKLEKIGDGFKGWQEASHVQWQTLYRLT